MIRVEIQESSPRFQNFVAEESNEEKRVNLDLLDEVETSIVPSRRLGNAKGSPLPVGEQVVPGVDWPIPRDRGARERSV